MDPDIGGLVDRYHLALHLGYAGSSLLVTNLKLSMIIDNFERSNRGGAGRIIRDFLSIGKALGGEETEINESPTACAESCP